MKRIRESFSLTFLLCASLRAVCFNANSLFVGQISTSQNELELIKIFALSLSRSQGQQQCEKLYCFTYCIWCAVCWWCDGWIDCNIFSFFFARDETKLLCFTFPFWFICSDRFSTRKNKLQIHFRMLQIQYTKNTHTNMPLVRLAIWNAMAKQHFLNNKFFIFFSFSRRKTISISLLCKLSVMVRLSLLCYGEKAEAAYTMSPLLRYYYMDPLREFSF